MSEGKIEGLIMPVANSLFGWDWKPIQPKNLIDLITLPSMNNITHNWLLFKVMVLNVIVEAVTCPEVFRADQ